MEGQTAQFTASARYSDGSSQDVTSRAAWSSSAPLLAAVDAIGRVEALKAGSLEISAQFEDKASAMRLTVSPSPLSGVVLWNQLPPLSAAAKDFIVQYNLQRQYSGAPAGTVKRWVSFPIPVYADPGFSRQNLQEAIDFWRAETAGKVVFSIVSSQSEAKIVFGFDEAPIAPGNCGVEGPEPSSIAGSIITRGYGWYSRRAECAPNGDWKIGLAHGLGHILGLGGHTPSGSDLMGSPQSDWRSSSLLNEIINWIYSVPAGTRPQ